MTDHGTPIWFELATPDTARAEEFYSGIFGWQMRDAGMEGFAYTIAHAAAEPVSGIYDSAAGAPGPAPLWLVYLTVSDADAAAQKATALGGRILTGPADIPGTGRFAVLADPQGAPFGVLAPAATDPPSTGAFNPRSPAHGAWIELMSTDPDGGLDFYEALFGWAEVERIDMGTNGEYRVFAHAGERIGGVTGLGSAPAPAWLPYFSVENVADTVARSESEGGRWIAGPVEIPGAMLIAVLADPSGAAFAVIGPQP